MKRQLLFLSHGGGPLPLLGDPGHQDMVNCLQTITARLKKPSAIVVVSAHWEEGVPAITAAEAPPLIYDYYGFPEESYEIQYPCPGHPTLAQQIYSQLHHAGVEAKLDKQRGFDHGLFVPLKIMYPEADIPCVQISLLNNLDPEQHLQLGEALSGLNLDNLLIIGSGFSFHNMQQFFAPPTPDSVVKNEAFESWLLETCSSPSLSEQERRLRLRDWATAPAARFCHPREEHLLPLQVCYGIAQTHCSQTFELKVLGKKASMYLWQ